MGKLYVVGIGPGDTQYMTAEACTALERAEILCGYPRYLERIESFCQGKECFSTPMKQEIERCRKALQLAQSGKTVALVCSGDAGVYGMASLILELLSEYDAVEVEIVAGVTAALSGAAVLGAPLGHDFCVISLSDLLTPWEYIETRLRCAAEGDFVIVLYNPSSQKRANYLRKACDILLQWRNGDTACGLVRNIGCAEQEARILTLCELLEISVDMMTTVFIGSSATKQIGKYLVTPRGYSL